MKKLISWLIRHIPRKYLQRFTGIGRVVFSIVYAGNSVECPVCKKQFRKFLPYGRIEPRENALCPNCLSLERHRLIWLYLDRQTDFFNSKHDVLHIAPEVCFIKRFEKIHQDRYITGDLESPWAKVKMDIHHIPFPENSFDVVLCNHVLEHVQDDIQAMREIHRVLRPGGYAIMQVPFFHPIPEVTLEDTTINDPAEREKLFGQDDHVRKYGKDFTQRMSKAGFKPVADEFVATLTPELSKRYGLMTNEIIYKGIKES